MSKNLLSSFILGLFLSSLTVSTFAGTGETDATEELASAAADTGSSEDEVRPSNVQPEDMDTPPSE